MYFRFNFGDNQIRNNEINCVFILFKMSLSSYPYKAEASVAQRKKNIYIYIQTDYFKNIYTVLKLTLYQRRRDVLRRRADAGTVASCQNIGNILQCAKLIMKVVKHSPLLQNPS